MWGLAVRTSPFVPRCAGPLDPWLASWLARRLACSALLCLAARIPRLLHVAAGVAQEEKLVSASLVVFLHNFPFISPRMAVWSNLEGAAPIAAQEAL